MSPRDPRRDLLIRIGSRETAHSRSSLLRHLEGTQSLLDSWGARPALSDAGLFHSAYGTESFDSGYSAAQLRRPVRHAIGPEAEEIVYLNHRKDSRAFFRQISLRSGHPEAEGAPPGVTCRFTGERIPCTVRHLEDLANLCLANALEQAPRVPQYYGPEEGEKLSILLPLALPAARAAFAKYFTRPTP